MADKKNPWGNNKGNGNKGGSKGSHKGGSKTGHNNTDKGPYSKGSSPFGPRGGRHNPNEPIDFEKMMRKAKDDFGGMLPVNRR